MTDVLRADDFIEELDELLEDERFKWAWPTIGGIRDTIDRTKRVSPGQYTAIRNIRESVKEASDRPRWGRRYEGL